VTIKPSDLASSGVSSLILYNQQTVKMNIQPSSNYPLPTQSSLQLQYVGRHLSDVLTPAAIIDRSIVRRNCNAMLEVCRGLNVGFRAHVKSHKTLEIAKLQVGSEGPAHFVVSTLIEAENLLPFLLECQSQCRPCSVLYGVPIPQSAVPRLLQIASKLAPGTFNILIDNADALAKFQEKARTGDIGIYIKIDTGYHRAGITTSSPKFSFLVKQVIESSGPRGSHFRGFYSHFGHSYAGSNEDDAANGLIEELQGLEVAAKAVPDTFTGQLVLTVGATPTATAVQNMLSSQSPRAQKVKTIIERLQKQENFEIELHAGVYPLLDLQQVATGARPANGKEQPGFQPLSKSNIGLRMLLEVTSIYDERGKPEALVSAGSLAMGREPCKSYPGWGIVTPYLGNQQNKDLIYDERGEKTGWIIGRISQEHGILSWEGPREKMQPLTIGDKLLVWPNHACVAGAGFGWYLIVDSEVEGGEKVIDVWVRWRGW
jgi:D-serine deaminase-like pyridoxal phosphate-dependent protein